jgi:hypothetical protein
MEEVQDDAEDGVAGGVDIKLWGGLMKGHWENISLSWPGDERFAMTDEQMRVKLYTAAIRWVETDFSSHESLFESISCFHVLTLRFTRPTFSFPFYKLQQCAFVSFTRFYFMSSTEASY